MQDRRHGADDALRCQRRRLADPAGFVTALLQLTLDDLDGLRAALERTGPRGERLHDAQPPRPRVVVEGVEQRGESRPDLLAPMLLASIRLNDPRGDALGGVAEPARKRSFAA